MANLAPKINEFPFHLPITSFAQARQFIVDYPARIGELFKKVYGEKNPIPQVVASMEKRAGEISNQFAMLSERAQKGEAVEAEQQQLVDQAEEIRSASQQWYQVAQEKRSPANPPILNNPIQSVETAQHFIKNVAQDITASIGVNLLANSVAGKSHIKQENWKVFFACMNDLKQAEVVFNKALPTAACDTPAKRKLVENAFIARVEGIRQRLLTWQQPIPARISRIWFATLFIFTTAAVALTGYAIKRYFKL